MLGAVLFPYIFNTFKQTHPHLDLIIIEEGTLNIESLLEKGELDVGIITISNISSHIEILPVATGEICVCLPLSHPLGQFSRIPFSELSDQPFILLKEDTYARQLVLAECMKYGFCPNIVFSTSQIETILGLVEQGVGISFLLDSIAQKHSNILSRPLVDALLINAGLAWNKKRYLSKAAQAFIDAISKVQL